MAYKPTAAIVRKTLRKLNKKIYGNLLEVDSQNLKVEIEKLDTEWGYVDDESDPIILGLNEVYPNKHFFEEVVCHEMAHLMQVALELKVNHGKTFNKIGKHALKYGYDIHSHQEM